LLSPGTYASISRMPGRGAGEVDDII